MKKVLVLNGPPRCGKDTAAEAIVKHIGSEFCVHLKLSQPLKDIAQYIMPQSAILLEAKKEVPLPGNQHSYRDAQIHIFNQMVPIFGKGWLGHALVNRINRQEIPNIVVSDCGRNEELTPIIREYSTNNVSIIQIMRAGTAFKNDIRTYVSGGEGIMPNPVVNKQLPAFIDEVTEIAEEFFS